ncbi:MAG: phosphohydrolase [Fusobacterium sp.]|nr:phosphohydrolase [Fusobacterium sp.]
MIISRVKQCLTYLFLKYDVANNDEVREILSDYEFELFLKMTNYDKLHSYNLLKKVKKNELLSKKILFQKLALLHDCGKGNTGLLRRIKKVLIGDKLLEQHTNIAYKNLKKHNQELAILCRFHHDKTEDKFMQEFQRLDDE